jgi:aspartate/methionine/tyrosine aminotransferase
VDHGIEQRGPQAGRRVYPFHLGDMNIPTPRNIMDATYKAMKDGKTGYCSNYGITPLREIIAANLNASHGTHYSVDNVVIQPGGKPTIGKFILALMNPGDEVLYPNPGYPISRNTAASKHSRATSPARPPSSKPSKNAATWPCKS